MGKSENLYTDGHPENTIEGLDFKDQQKAEESIAKVQKLISKNEITVNHAKQICVAMEQRFKHHPHRNEDMKSAEKIWRSYLEKLKAMTEKAIHINFFLLVCIDGRQMIIDTTQSNLV